MSYLITSTNTGVVLSNATQNPSTVQSGAYVTNNNAANHNGDAIYGTKAAAWTLSNYGTVKATATYASGIDLIAGGYVTNGSTALIIGYNAGVSIYGGSGTVSNFGFIEATATSGIDITKHSAGIHGASIQINNGSTGTITGYNGAYIVGQVVSNSGAIVGSGAAGIGIILLDVMSPG